MRNLKLILKRLRQYFGPKIERKGMELYQWQSVDVVVLNLATLAG